MSSRPIGFRLVTQLVLACCLCLPAAVLIKRANAGTPEANHSQSAEAAAASRRAELWQSLAQAFEPPAEFNGTLDDRRSPLVFDDGSIARTPADWHRRRAEILTRWHRQMGQWPPVITEPRVEVLGQTQQETFTRQRIRFDLAPGHPVVAWLLQPNSPGPHPGVVVVYYEPDTGLGLRNQQRDFALQLARRGFATLSVGHDYSLYYPSREQATIQPLSALAYGAANAYHVLASRPDVDAERIGITGHSYGGKWAMFASCLYDRFACAAWSDGGIVFDESRGGINYWEPWYLGYDGPEFRQRGLPTKENPARGLYPKLRAAGHDLHELHALMAPRPFLVSGGAEDRPARWLSLNHAVAVNRLLGQKNRVAMTNRETHGPTPESNAQLYRFFEYFLQHAPAAGEPPATTP